MWVVKLGGSLHDSPALRDRLAELATLPGPGRIVAPGGGPFADLVRRLQPNLEYDDLTAHRMAILAMQQFGLALHALEPRLSLAESEPELRAARAAILLPWRLAGLAPEIAASWDVTSDSLACWLATRLGASRLVLVKSASELAGNPADWAKAGLVDPTFPRYAVRFAGTIALHHRDEPLGLSGS